MSHEPLRVSLEDLRSADTKGKWWLVGAAWGGDPLLEHRESQIQAPAHDAPSENVLLKLAKKQGMNTDIRRGIFVVLMSSDVSAIALMIKYNCLYRVAGLHGCLRETLAAQAHRSAAARDHPCHLALLLKCSSRLLFCRISYRLFF